MPTASVEPPAVDTDAPYRALYDAMNIAVLLMRGPACVSCNPATCQLFGVNSPNEIIGKTPLDFAPEFQPNGMSSAQMVADNFMQAHAKGTHVFEWLAAKVDGQTMILEVRFTMLKDLGDLYLCTAFDISERKQTERALSDSEARFRTIFERAVEGILVAEVSSKKLRFANAAICRMLGYEHDELIALAMADIHPPENWTEVETALVRYFAGERFDLETACLCKDGSHCPVIVCAAPLELAGEKVIIGFFNDITMRRQLDEQRLKAQKLDAVGRLAGGIAHDFNNLLQGVFGYISLARIAQDNASERFEMLEQAENALQQASHLTTQLLTFSKGGQPLKRAVEIGPLLRSAIGLALSGTPSDCHFALSEDLETVEADEGQINQVIHNIVLNASQSMPLGGTIYIAAKNVQAPLVGLPPQLPAGRFVAISIRDTGVGIPSQYLSKIFDPYFTTKEKGTGLGLATSYAIINNHRGVIDVQSGVGEGSAFTIYLPVSDATGAISRPPKADVHPANRRARLLLMDDDPIVLDVTARLLRRLDCEVDVVEHGGLAVDRYRRAISAGTPYDLVILDLTVRGGIGGIETAQLLRTIDPEVRVVVASGYSDEIARVEHGKDGIQAFLKKPFDLETLRCTLAPLLR